LLCSVRRWSWLGEQASLHYRRSVYIGLCWSQLFLSLSSDCKLQQTKQMPSVSADDRSIPQRNSAYILSATNAGCCRGVYEDDQAGQGELADILSEHCCEENNTADCSEERPFSDDLNSRSWATSAVLNVAIHEAAVLTEGVALLRLPPRGTTCSAHTQSGAEAKMHRD
jgi:hypothetical protein